MRAWNFKVNSLTLYSFHLSWSRCSPHFVFSWGLQPSDEAPYFTVVGWLFPCNGSRLYTFLYEPAEREELYFIREKHVFTCWKALTSFSFERRSLFIPTQTSGLTELADISFQALRLNKRGKEKKKKNRKERYQLLELLFRTFQGTWNTWKFLIYVIYDVFFYTVFIIVLFYKWRCRVSPESSMNGQEVISFSFF